jgi:hypothetical protein
MDTAATVSEQKAKIAQFRQEFLNELPALAREYIDTARAESTTQAFEKVMNTAVKVIEGLQVAEKADKYANLPVINFTIGAGVQVTTIEAAAQVPAVPNPDVTDVEPKPVSPFKDSGHDWSLPDNPTDLLPSPDEPGAAATLAALDLASGAMALPD